MKEDNHIYWRDEILQLLFWMRGEGMGETHSPAEVARFLSIDPQALAAHVGKMIDAGYLAALDDRFALSDLGRTEGARRFREEFEPLLAQGHGECSDPDCDCHQLGPEHCKSHTGEGV